MKLRDLLEFENVVVQCHDNPDADALASGYAIWSYFKAHGRTIRFVYGGKFIVTKTNLKLMIKDLEIPVEHVTKLECPDLLITVDCQYGGGNVTEFEAKNIAIIDHHQVCVQLPKLSDVRSNLGSCATLCYDLLREEDFNVNADEKLATALYYGLMTDTDNFSEMTHPLDRDLQDEAKVIKSEISLFKNSNISFEELMIAGEALLNYTYDASHEFAMVCARQCDPNILGIISDMLLEVDTITSCIVYSVHPFGIKLSVRSCTKEINAGELAEYVAKDIGNGGGHRDKAGGFLQTKLLNGADPTDVIKAKVDEYFKETTVIYAKDFEDDMSDYERYVKKPVSLGYVPMTEICEEGTKVCVRTLEGDLEFEASSDAVLVIGVKGEVYPSRKVKFDRGYISTDKQYVFHGEYIPSVIDFVTGDRINILPRAKVCYPTGDVKIYAKPLKNRVKIFAEWDEEKYMLGKPGDYLAVRSDDLKDVYIIEKSVFEATYKLA